jgi:hypothetical protein
MEGKDADQELAEAIELLESGKSLGKVSEPACFRRDVMLKAVELHVTNLSFVTDEFKSDPDCMLKAVKADPVAMEYADSKLFRDKAWISEVLDINPRLFNRAKGEAIEDYDVCLSACTKHGMNLQYVSPELRNNRNLVLAAVQENGPALAFASTELKNDSEIVWAAVKNNRMAYAHASPKMKKDNQLHDYVTSQLDEGKEDIEKLGSARKMKELFRRADADGSGYIDAGDLARLLTRLDGQAWTHMRAYRLLNAMDKNGDGYVSFEEFVDWIHAGCAVQDTFEVAMEHYKEKENVVEEKKDEDL